MPYKNFKDLPASVQKNLPTGAQKIYLEAYNHAWDKYKSPKDRDDPTSTREETAHKIAWAAVKRQYMKDPEGRWVKIK